VSEVRVLNATSLLSVLPALSVLRTDSGILNVKRYNAIAQIDATLPR
jgi:hypothetical protein